MSKKGISYQKDLQFYKFCAYGFFKNLRFFDPFLLLFFLEKGVSYAQIGILYGVREISINTLEVPSGVIADIVGRKRSLIFAFAAYIISFLMFYFLTGFAGFLVAFVFYGVGDAFRSGTHKAMILAYLKKNGWEDSKTAYYGRTRSWSQRGSALASILSAAFVFYTGSYKFIFLLSVIPYIIDLFLMMSYPSYLNGDDRQQKPHVGQLFKEFFASVKQAFSEWKPFRIIVTTSSYTGYYKAVKDFIQPLLVGVAISLPFLTDLPDKKKSAIVIGVIYSILYLINATVSQRVYKIEALFKDVLSGLVIIQLFGWIGGLVAGIMYVLECKLMAILFFAFVLIVQNARRPLAVKYVSGNFDDKIMATVLSAESQSETIFTSVFAVILGFLVQYMGVGYGLICISSILIIFNFAIRFFNK